MFKSLIGLLLVVTLCAAVAPTRFRTNARRSSIARDHFFARQQAAPLAPTAPTGYPAAGVTPEIPFDLPSSSTAKPDVTYLPPQPEATYGPPAPHSTYGPPVTPDAVYGPPDNTYLPPDESVTARDVGLVDEEETTVDEQQPSEPQPEVRDQPKKEVEEPAEEEGEEIYVAVAEDGAVIAVSNSFDAKGANNEPAGAAQQQARLVFQRFPQGRRRTPADMPVPARLIKSRRVAPAKLQLLQHAQPQAQPQAFPFNARYTGW